jgi:DNA-directed RNA polymerase specialized sigma24 family protein
MTMTPRSALTKIETASRRLAGAEMARDVAVALAMEEGCSWAEIGAALGVSAQAAHRRFRWLRHSPVTGECWREPPLGA